MTQSKVPGPNLGSVTIGGTVTEKQDQPASTTATWTSATALNTAVIVNTIGYGTANVSIQTPSTATAGAITIEVSDDNSVWYPPGAARIDNTLAENVVQVAGPGIAQTRMYAVSVDAMTQVRVRLSTVIAGTGNTVVRVGTVAGDIEPLVATIPPRTMCAFHVTAVTAVVAETLMSITPVRGVTTGGAGTTMTVTAGRTLRITAITASLLNTAAAANQGIVSLRAKASGTIATSDPVIWHGRVAAPAAVANTAGTVTVTLFHGIDLPSGYVFGLSSATAAITGAYDVTINGYEF